MQVIFGFSLEVTNHLDSAVLSRLKQFSAMKKLEKIVIR
ncbi:hypothetical protein A2U01_0088221, partial [Trifolium medium]|nr:hypothetical protein [Trifolium medium]